MRTKTLSFISACLVLLMTIPATSKADDKEYVFEVQRRINAHGDEFMAVALTKDERYLIIGAESGKLIVWDIAQKRIVKELDQGSPVHCVVALNDPDACIAAGGPHAGATQSAAVRKWRISTGASEELSGITEGTIVSLAFDPKSELVAAGSSNGHLIVWNATNGKTVAKRSFDAAVFGLALNDREIYLTQLDPTVDEPKNSIVRLRVDEPNLPETTLTQEDARQLWTALKVSPDRRLMAAHSEGDEKPGVVLFDLSSGKEISTFEAASFAWCANGQLLLFNGEVAVARVTIDAHGQISQAKVLEEAQFQAAGAPSEMRDEVVSKEGSTAWGIYPLGAMLTELELNNKHVNKLYQVDGNLFAFDVNEKLDLVASGGDDELVRVRKLSDLSLAKEFKVELGVPQGVALMQDGRHVVFSSGAEHTPTRISIGDLATGKTRTLFELPEPFVQVKAAGGGFIYKDGNRLVLAEGVNGTTLREYAIEGDLGSYAVSANGRWLVSANSAGKLFRFEIKSGKRTVVGHKNVEDLTGLAITNNGGYVYTTEFRAKLRRWDTGTGAMKELSEITGQAHAVELSRDEREIIIGGNHRDVAIIDIASGEERLYVKVSASDFYVTNVWLGGDRLLFSTDVGVLFDGVVKR